MSNIFIKPAMIEVEGVAMLAHVRDPESFKPLAAGGEWKRRTQYWTRRLRDKDVIEADLSVESAPVVMPDHPQFGPCAACVTPDACTAADRCVKAPIV